MSLMLLGVRQQDESQSTPVALCIAAASSSNGAHATEDGLSTPLPATTAAVAPAVTSASAMTTSTASSTRVTAPHLSPIADKQQHVTPWRVAAADTDKNKDKLKHERPSLSTPEPVKRPRRACTSTHARSKINDLFSDTRTDSSKPAVPSSSSTASKKSALTPPKASKSTRDAVSTTRKNSHQHQPERRNLQLQHDLLTQGDADEAVPGSSSSPGQYCAVAGCLRIVHELSKCALHKGLKLCSAGGCFRPVQSRGFCKSHGGGARCKHPGCTKGAISKGRCRTHGGGTRCAIPSCSKWAQRFGCCVRHSKAFAAAGAGPDATATSSSRAGVCV